MIPPKITLAIIAGNVEHYIERFLQCFGPLADEIVIVRAIGSQTPDGTQNKAFSFSLEHEIPMIQRDYVNSEKGKDWPHVDDFAAARNLAFSLASNEWIFWADTDDVLTPESISAIKLALAQAEEKQIDAFQILYDVPQDGVKVMKDRLVRNGKAVWQNAIHEELHLLAENPRVATIQNAVIVHAAEPNRKVNDERNLRLLESIAPETRPVGLTFHLVMTLLAVKRIEDCKNLAADLLMNAKELGKTERYELFMVLAQLSQDNAERGQFFLQALAIDPCRREAYGDLITYSMNARRFEDTLGYALAMNAIPEPEVRPWNQRDKYYHWLGVQLLGMALRANGQGIKADILEINHFKKHGARISLLHATRGRPHMAAKTRQKWLDMAHDADAIEHIFAFDEDDDMSFGLQGWRHIVVPSGGGCVRAWNAAAESCSGEILIQLSDDWEPTLHWDKEILAQFDSPEPRVLAISDGHRQDKLLCMAILNRARYKQQGFLFHPDFTGVFSDNYFTDRAYADGVVKDAKHIIFQHQHPFFNAGEMDETYARQNSEARYKEGLEIYKQLTAKSHE